MLVLPLPIVAGFGISILGQFIALTLILATRGFTAVGPTLLCIFCFVASLAIFAKLAHAGVQLSFLTSSVTAAVQIFVLIVGVTVYGESASLAKNWTAAWVRGDEAAPAFTDVTLEKPRSIGQGDSQ